jgi:hypothetical protein
MSGPVAAALIAALGTVIVALINSLVTRGQSRDARARLQKDTETIGKLEKGSPEFSAMEEHIQRSVLLLTYTERPRKPEPSKRWGLVLLALSILSFQWFNWNVTQNTAHTRSTSQNEHKGITAWINDRINARINVYIHDTFAQNSSIQALLLTAMFIFYFCGISWGFYYQRQLRRAKVVDEVEEKIREIRQQSGNQDDISTQSTSSTSDP